MTRDAQILALWRSGKRALEIAGIVGLPETRVIHEVNRLLNESAAAMPDKLIWTFTMLDAFENCNYKGFRKYLAQGDLRVPYVEGSAQRWGNIAHTAFEKRINHGEPLPKELEEFEPRVRALLPHKPRVELKLGIRTDGSPCGFYECEDGDGRGKIDLVFVKDNHAIIFDWKTASNPREDPRELAIQALMLKAKHPELLSIVAHYVWLTPGTLGRAHNVSDTAATWRRVQGVVQNIRQKLAANWFPKNENPLCPWCEVPYADCEFRKPIPNR